MAHPWDSLERVVHRGWAPCAHSDAERAALAADYFIPGATIEALIFNINQIGGAPRCAVDQWWGVFTEGPISVKETDERILFCTSIYGDSLLLALTETFKVWCRKVEELSGSVDSDDFIWEGWVGEA